MLSDRRIIGIIAAVLVIVVLAGWMMALPNYRRAAEVRLQIAQTRTKIDELELQADILAKLAAEASKEQKRVDTELKAIPESPGLAELIRKLSFPVDKVHVADQTFTAGSASEALVGSKSSMRAMPLTVEMEASFGSVFALLRSAESMNRLLRVTSVSISCKRDDKKGNPSLVKASVGLEAIYDPPAALEER